jgi:hypothetical protein
VTSGPDDGLAKETATEMDVVFPDVSVAFAVTVWEPLGYAEALIDSVQLDVPVASWSGPESTWTSTLASEALSAADPVAVIVPETLAPFAGVVIEIVGATVSVVVVHFRLHVRELPPPAVAACAPVTRITALATNAVTTPDLVRTAFIASFPVR